jgi:hypothetical protein
MTDKKEPEHYEFMVDDIPLRVELYDSAYDGVIIRQDGDEMVLPPKYILWLAERVREYYPGVKPFDPCKDGGA